ncbi:uncharacterized protein LOC124271874 isoform X1 [Haliotis rubra]|uniref:uncharacterized protein LOC124271874 isoform X1 n=1 Tax=Haliotis rubra TaxID=36100 RepID=UPI001EE52B28|nr:uncharacterized protein LOC124271874 isoform X1 [Haliotis rubra]
MWRKYLLPVTLTLCVISDVISGQIHHSEPRRARLRQLDYRRDFTIGPDETDFIIGPDETDFSFRAILRDMDIQIPVDQRRPTSVSPILLSMMCAYCRQQGNQPCIDRICSRTTVERGSAVA